MTICGRANKEYDILKGLKTPQVTLNWFQGLFMARYNKEFGNLFYFYFLPFEITDFGSPASGEHYFTKIFGRNLLLYFDY